MLDNKGNILLLPSPLKGIGRWLFGDNRAKNQALEDLYGKDGDGGIKKSLDDMQSNLMSMQVSNPYASFTNAFAGLTNAYEGADNVYDEAENVYEGKMENAFAGQKNAYEGMKNQMEGMENAFEDLTVNTQQAEFEAQQNQQMQANIMSQMSGAAGGSGIAALAQSMANQGALQAQKASASIGAQESANMAKAAEAEQSINLKTADEASRIANAQAGEQSKLDTQKNMADMEIQNKILGADEALQNQKLGEASKLQMAQMGAQHEMDQAEAAGQQQLDQDTAAGDMWMADTNIGLQKTNMEVEMSKYAAAAAQAAAPQDSGAVLGVITAAGQIAAAVSGSDIRLKENITKIKYSDSGIPIYTFNYKGENTLWSGTMAQDLLGLNREDAVVTMDNGYYGVKYDLIDVDMEEIKKPSPLKQLQGKAKEQAGKDKQLQSEGTMDAGMDILSEAQRRKNWEELQKLARASEPKAMQIRKEKDRILRQYQRDLLGPKAIIELPGLEGVANNNAYTKGLISECKRYQDLLYKAVQKDDKEAEQEINTNVAGIKRMTDRYREETQEFMADHFGQDIHLSKGCSQQQISIATQLYCQNPDANIFFAEKRDVERGRIDYYGKPVVEGQAYAVCYDFQGNFIMVNILEGNSQMWVTDLKKAIEYVGFLNEIHEGAKEAAANKQVSDIKPILGKINHKIDELFGNNDGTATLKQNEIVMQFCWDQHILKDGSSFRRHLYEHPNIQNLNYGGFDWENMKLNLPLGEGDVGHWTDNIDELDQIALVDAITNQDHEFFDIDLLRTLVKEYYAYKIENAWWKGMGFDEGKLTVMRLKQKEMIKIRFEKDKAKAASDGQVDFTFDGKVYPTGLDVEQVKKEEAIQNKKMKEGIANAQKQKPNIQ